VRPPDGLAPCVAPAVIALGIGVGAEACASASNLPPPPPVVAPMSSAAPAQTPPARAESAGALPSATTPLVVSLPEAGGSGSPSAPEANAYEWTPPAPPDPGQASDKCTGRATQELVNGGMARAAMARPCYKHALNNDRTLRGKMRVLVRLREDGSVREAHVIASDMPSEMNDCVMQILRSSSYPAPVGGCIDMAVPMSFLPADAGAPAQAP
jgi:outer membrane biosynthesis protein TonB